MASQEEHNKFECTTDVNKDQERSYLNVYKKFESILNDKSEKFENKVQSLIEVWKSISELNFSQFDIKYVIQIIDWAKLHALNIVLTGEWRSTKDTFRDNLLQSIENAQESLANVNDAFSTRCQKLADVVKKPWEDPVLNNLIQDRDTEIGSQEIEFFCVETAYLVSVRLKKLCENHCEDLALNLVTNFLKCKKQAAVQNFNLNATETQLWFIFDIYIALLYKFQDKAKILEQFEELTLDEGVQLIKRFAKKRVKISKIWRNCHKIAIFGCRFFLSKTLIKYNVNMKDLLTELLKTYLSLSSATDTLLQEFVVSVRNLTNLADAEGLCIMCDNIHREAAVKLRHFAIEMYIRALTTDMNELERLKHANEEEKVKLTTSRLARTFSNLADLLDDHVKVARECILTAFSLEPTKERLQLIVELAKRSGFPVLDTGQEWKCRLHPPVLPTDELAWVCPECGEWMCKPELTAPLQMNTPLQEALQGSILGISEALCDDLVVCLSNPRYQILSWLLSWGDLYRLCILYLNDPEKTKNFVTELKFVDVDYSMFQHIKREPLDEYTGIEKGYEQYLDIDFVSDEETSSVSEDSTSHDKCVSLGSDGSGEPNSSLTQQSKSDPDTLKSLRMFRPSLKRRKDEIPFFVTDKRVPCLTPDDWSASAETEPKSCPFLVAATAEKNTGQTRKENLFVTGSVEIASRPFGASSNSVFNSANLSSMTSTSYVSNIIKSGLTFGVPKVAAKIPNRIALHSNTPAIEAPRKIPVKQRHLMETPVHITPHNSKRSRDNPPKAPIENSSGRRSPSPGKVSDLDALLREVVEDMDMESTLTESKNVVAAILPQLGGQVAEDQNQLIQVPLVTPSKLRPETFSPNGISDVCTTKQLKAGCCPGNSEVLPLIPDVLPHRKRKLIDPEVSLPGCPPAKVMNLVVRLTKLNVEACSRNYRNRKEDKATASTSCREKELMIRLKPLDHGVLVSKLICKVPRIRIVRSKLLEFIPKPPEPVRRLPTQVLTVRLTSTKSIIGETVTNQTSAKTTDAPLVTPLVPQTVDEPTVKTPVLHTLLPFNPPLPIFPPAAITVRETSFHREIVVLHTICKATPYQNLTLDTKRLTSLVSVPTLPPSIPPSVQRIPFEATKKAFSVPFRLEDAILVPRDKLKQVLSLASLTRDTFKTTLKTADLFAICDPSKSIIHSETLELPSKANQKEVPLTLLTGDPTSDYDRDNWLVSRDGKTDLCSTEIITSTNNRASTSYKIVEVEQDLLVRCAVESDASVVSNEADIATSTDVKTTNNVVDNFNTLISHVNMLNCDSKSSSRGRSVVSCPIKSRICDNNNEDVLMQIEGWIKRGTETFHSAERHDPRTSTANQTACRNDLSENDRTPSRKLVANSSRITNLDGSVDGRILEKELRVNVEKVNFVQYVHNYSKETKEKILTEDVQKKSRTNSKEAVGHTEGHYKSDKFAFFLDQFESHEYRDRNRNIDKENRKTGTSPGFDVILPKLAFPCDRSPIRRYTNSRKRKHDDVPCFKLDQEKEGCSSRSRRLTVTLKRLPEIISTPDVKVFVSDRLKSNLDSAEDGLKKTSPLADCNIRSKLDTFFTDKRSKRRKPNIFLGSANNFKIQVRIYDNKFYNVVAKVASPVEPYDPFKIQIPGLNDYSEILPRNVNHVVNVVQHTVSRPTSVSEPNAQTSTQVTPHIQRVGQPKMADRKTDRLVGGGAESLSECSSSVAVSPATNAQQSTLINILSSGKAGQKSPPPRQGPFVNILSQQIIRPTSGSATDRPTTTVIKVEAQDRAEAQATKSVNTNLRIVTTTTQAGIASTSSSPAQGGAILQFICKSSSLPKFQQAFGKSNVYQRASGDSIETTSSNETQTAKVSAAKALPATVQPISGNVIFRGQVPVGQTVSLIPPGSNTRQLFRITGSSHEQISLVKETVIQNKMSALLAAALQGKPKITEQNGEVVEEYSATRITLCRPGSVPPTAARIIKPVQVQIPANALRAPQPNVSSTTLEQLREFDMVYKQVKERSSNTTQMESVPRGVDQESPQQQRISFTYVNQVQKYTQLAPVVVVSSYGSVAQNVVTSSQVSSQDSPPVCHTSAASVPKVAVKLSKAKNIRTAVSKSSPPTAVASSICKPQQKPQEDEHTTQRIFDILAEYAEQLRNSPDLNNKPAPRRRSNPPSNPNSNPTAGSPSTSTGKKKKKKNNGSASMSLVETDNEDLTMGSEDSSSGNVVQLSMTDEEQSQSASITPPEPNLEHSVPVTGNSRPVLIATDQPRNVIIADSSVNEALKMPNTAVLMPGNYIMPVSVVKGGQQIAVVSGGSKIFTTVPTRSGQNMLLFQSFVNQKKKGTVSAVKYSTLQPFSGISTQSVSTVHTPVVVPSNSLTTVALGQTITLKKLDEIDKVSNTELLLTIAPPKDSCNAGGSSSNVSQPDSSTSLSVVASVHTTDSIDAIQTKTADQPAVNHLESVRKTFGVATSVIAAATVKKDPALPDVADATVSTAEEHLESVLVKTSVSNGPMLSNAEAAKYGKCQVVEGAGSTRSSPKEFANNLGKGPQEPTTRVFKTNAIYYAIRTKKGSNKKTENEIQKQAAIERELRLQKSLSEECEDLGVDEPSTSDLFPEADLLFDSNHSPSYEQQKTQNTETKAKHQAMHLFSDDENSEPLRNDLFEYMGCQASVEGVVDQRNGNVPTPVESAFQGEDCTLLASCAAVSEVTLTSPLSPNHGEATHPPAKYKYKYSNKKKHPLNKQPAEGWQAEEVTSSQDSVERSKGCESTAALFDKGDKTVAIREALTPNGDDCTLTRCPVHNSVLDGGTRSSRKTLRRSCSCVNGLRTVGACGPKKRANTQSPVSNKKPAVLKKR